MFRIGDVVGSYTILAHLRTGGMASLYLARRSGAAGFRRHVAIKVVHPRLSDDSGLVQMFVDEAVVTSRIDHPNVVHVEELGELEGTYYLVMEYVHGCSLAQLLRALGRAKRRLSPPIAVAICARVAEGLHAAHETTGEDGRLLNLVHRDVSPQNILLSHKGHVKLIDFGVAKAKLRRDESNTMSLKGKVRYMAPEQAAIGTVDRRVDVYALGIVLWELLTMRRLFSGRTEFEILMQVRKPRIVAPSRYATEIPGELDAVLLRALAPDPADRFANAKELRRALIQALPRAAGIDSAHLADLLATTMGDALDRERNELPDDVSRVLRAEQLRVAGLEQAERGAGAAPPVAPHGAAPAVLEDAYTLHSGELHVEDDDAPPAAGDEGASPDPTVRAQRPPDLLLAPRTPGEHEPVDEDPTTVSAELLPVLRASQRVDRAPASSPPGGARPVIAAAGPGAPAYGLAGYGLALGVSIGIGVALALWGPSCLPSEAGSGSPASRVAPASVSPGAPLRSERDGAPQGGRIARLAPLDRGAPRSG